MKQLVAAAQREGTLNAVAIPRDWANYGALIDEFERRYGVKVNIRNPSGSSSEAVSALRRLGASPQAPDVVDIDPAHAETAAKQGLFAPYRVATYADVPAAQKDPMARFYSNYGGYVSIGCDAGTRTACPTTFSDLKKPEYRGKVALNGDPRHSGSALSAVFAAALANGGSFDDVRPGIDFFRELAHDGIYISTQPSRKTIVSGETPIVIDWDYLNQQHWQEVAGEQLWTTCIPVDGEFSRYYAMAINVRAPHPAAARLWQEYLFSPEAQNLRLEGFARPVLMTAMERDKTLHLPAAGWLPMSYRAPTEAPTIAQITAAKKVVASSWKDVHQP
ncbi:ABC transporter substrate-binding protein [Streptomyces sp. NPDC054887]